MTTTIDLIREHVDGAHAVTRLGCPVCADLPRQAAEERFVPVWLRRRNLEGQAKDLTGQIR